MISIRDGREITTPAIASAVRTSSPSRADRTAGASVHGGAFSSRRMGARPEHEQGDGEILVRGAERCAQSAPRSPRHGNASDRFSRADLVAVSRRSNGRRERARRTRFHRGAWRGARARAGSPEILVRGPERGARTTPTRLASDRTHMQFGAPARLCYALISRNWRRAASRGDFRLPVDFKSYGQAGGTVHVQRRARLPRTVKREFEPLETREQIRERNADLQTGQCRSQAEVNPMTKGQVCVGIACDVEAGWIGKLARIAVRRPDHRQDQAAGRNRFRLRVIRPECGAGSYLHSGIGVSRQ